MTMVALAYGFIWLAVFGYVFLVGRRLGRLHAELDDIRRRIDRDGTPQRVPKPSRDASQPA
jgi:CcmD family protein